MQLIAIMISVHSFVHPRKTMVLNPSQASSDLQLITLGIARLPNTFAFWHCDPRQER